MPNDEGEFILFSEYEKLILELDVKEAIIKRLELDKKMYTLRVDELKESNILHK